MLGRKAVKFGPLHYLGDDEKLQHLSFLNIRIQTIQCPRFVFDLIL